MTQRKRQLANRTNSRPAPNATYFRTIWGRFVSGAARAARFSDCNTGRLAPCRYKVSGIGLAPRG